MLAQERTVVSDHTHLLVNLDAPVNEADLALVTKLTGRDHQLLGRPNCPLIAVHEQPLSQLDPHLLTMILQQFDVLLDAAASEIWLAPLLVQVEQQPLAASTLVQLLRHNQQLPIQQAMVSESMAYSMLQHDQSFQAFIQQQRGMAAPQQSVVQEKLVQSEVSADGLSLLLTLNRPTKHNAFSAAMRDSLWEALSVPWMDETLERIVVRGAGPSFCSGGDLQEFGLANDAALAHHARLARHPGLLISSMRQRIEVNLHGACIGAGIELAAFAGTVNANPDSKFRLPEVGFGLIPGAGGTVSLPRRVGRHRTALLALSGITLTAETALAWGLIDNLSSSPE